MKTSFSRRIAGWALVAAFGVGTALAARSARKPFSPEAPDFRRRGGADAKVVIVEFSDFQCPACRVAEKPLRDLLALYGGRVRFVFKHFPLRMHEWARPAAIAAECAGRQGRFWEYHDRLYERQDEWPNVKCDDFLDRYARELPIDIGAWRACRQDPATAAAVAADENDGENAWVRSTPTFFINGKRFVGGRQLAELGPLFIDKELKR